MTWTHTVCGVLPIFGRGTFGPYPDALHSVEPGKYLLDYAFEQFDAAGILEVFIPISTRDIEWFARLVGYVRRGLEITYVEIAPGEPQTFYHYVVKASVKAGRMEDYTRYFVLNPCVRVDDPQWVAGLSKSCLAPYHLGITDCLFLDEGTIHKVRTAIKQGEGETCLAQILGTRYLEPADHLDLSKWEDIREWYVRKWRES